MGVQNTRLKEGELTATRSVCDIQNEYLVRR